MNTGVCAAGKLIINGESSAVVVRQAGSSVQMRQTAFRAAARDGRETPAEWTRARACARRYRRRRLSRPRGRHDRDQSTVRARCVRKTDGRTDDDSHRRRSRSQTRVIRPRDALVDWEAASWTRGQKTGTPAQNHWRPLPVCFSSRHWKREQYYRETVSPPPTFSTRAKSR